MKLLKPFQALLGFMTARTRLTFYKPEKILPLSNPRTSHLLGEVVPPVEAAGVGVEAYPLEPDPARVYEGFYGFCKATA